MADRPTLDPIIISTRLALQSSVELEKKEQHRAGQTSLEKQACERRDFEKKNRERGGNERKGWNLQHMPTFVCFLFICFRFVFVFEKRDVWGVRVSARYINPGDPNYHERQRAEESAAVTSQTQAAACSCSSAS